MSEPLVTWGDYGLADLFDDAAAREAVVADFREKTKGFTYKAFIPDGPPPLPAN